MQELSTYTQLSLQEMQEHPTWIINAFDPQERIIFWNNRCAQYFNVPPEQAMGKTLREILPREAKDERVNHIKRVLAGQHIILFQQTFYKTNRFYDQQLVPIKDNEGTIVAVLNIVKPLDKKD